MNILDLKPEPIWRYFYDFTQIPRPSKHEERIIEYLVGFAKEHNLNYKIDSIGNIVILKPATKGKENAPKVALQGHVDMVCEKNSDIVFDFMTQPIEAYIDGEWVKAKGTTLGADCAIGCAVMLAVLASDDIEHPALEALFTVDEESGLTGAFGIESHMITAKYLINLDSEDEGEVFVGCAGGKDTIASFHYTATTINTQSAMLEIKVKGLKGGHSGDDINKNLGNANIILARFLHKYIDCIDIIEIDGGNLRNAIPREARVVIATDTACAAKIEAEACVYDKILKNELFNSDSLVEFSCAKTVCSTSKAIDRLSAKNIIDSIYTAINGVVAMSQDMENFVESSTNLASVKQSEDVIVISTSQRSSVESKKEYYSESMKCHFERFGAEVEQSSGYPGWNPVLNSHLLDVFKKEHLSALGYEVKVKAIHAGLECGLFLAKFPHLEMVSYGPTLRGVHSPDEKLNIKATQECWKLIVSVLKNI